MDWEEALLMAWGDIVPLQPAGYYRRKAAHARQVAEGVTTRAVKERLLVEASEYDQLAAAADRTAAESQICSPTIIQLQNNEPIKDQF